jgi:hypothetical protein
MINAYHEPLTFQIQENVTGGWRRAINTGLESPNDIAYPGREVTVESLQYRLGPHSVAVLVSNSSKLTEARPR